MRPTAPSDAAIALLREQARMLDVEDLVDLCFAKEADALRTTIYLEALHGRPGEQAQVAACLLCFELARSGEERREAEVQVLLPTLEPLFQAEAARERAPLVTRLIGHAPRAEELWLALTEQAKRLDPRLRGSLPELDLDTEAVLEIFDEDEVAELSLDLEELEVVIEDDAEARAAFDGVLERLAPQRGELFFSAASGRDLDRLERVRAECSSYSSRVPLAAELHAMTMLFLATHTRAQGLFGRRNKRRDKTLEEGIGAFLALPTPPAAATAWFASLDMPGAEPHSWDKIAELLIDVASFLGDAPEGVGAGEPTAARPASSFGAEYANSARALRVPQVLAESGERRRRRA
ncbi:MAG: hypothetical protein ACO3JL_15675 [Myxococcota bacterium]